MLHKSVYIKIDSPVYNLVDRTKIECSNVVNFIANGSGICEVAVVWVTAALLTLYR